MQVSDLQKTFPELYQKLFSEHEVVLSGHLGFNRFPSGIWPTEHFISIKQKIKAKCWVGIKKVSQPGIRFGEILMFNGTAFSPYPAQHAHPRYADSLDFLAEQFGLKGLKYGFRIDVLAERGNGEGLGFTGTIFTLIVAGIGISCKRYTDLSSSSSEILELAHICTWKAKSGNAWASFYTTMMEGSHPHLYFTNTPSTTVEDIHFVHKDVPSLPDFLHLEHPSFTTLPVKWALLHTGERVDTIAVEREKIVTKSEHLHYDERFLQQPYETPLHTLLTHQTSYDIFHHTMGVLNTRLLYVLWYIYLQWPKHSLITELIHLLNTVNVVYGYMENTTAFLSSFSEACAKRAVSPTQFGVSPLYTHIHGGNYLIVFEKDNDLTLLEHIIQEMTGTTYPNISIIETYDFISPPSASIQIAQNLYQHHKADSARDLYLLITNDGEEKLISYIDIDPTTTQGLFLDAVQGKIYLNGTKLTSKELKSQVTTIELFEHLLQNQGHLRNSELSPSSFASQHNQMASKIIAPFNLLMERVSGKHFPLKSTQSSKGFDITLGETDFPISLVKKVST